MPLPDLYMVTNAIRELIETRASIAYNGTAGSVVTTAGSPQDGGDITTPVVNVYLFHLLENAHYKNQPPPRTGSGPVPIQHVPIGLDVHYVLTVRVPDSEARVASEHKLLGIVAKVVHDHPIITQSLFETPVLDDDDRFDLILRPVSLDEAITFWASDDIHVTRPSLFVEARIIQLEPEPPQVLPGIVLSVGTFIFTNLGPQLVSSRSQIAFVPPGFGVQRVSAEPARVALFEQGENPWPTGEGPPADAQPLILENNRLTLIGNGFGGGHRFLELFRSGVPEPVRIDLEEDPFPALNDPWDFEILSDRITLRFFTEVEDTAGNPVDLVPGIYAARLVIEAEPRDRISNQIAFAVIPQITDVNLVGTGVEGTIPFTDGTVVVMGAYLQEPSLEFNFVVGGQVLTKDNAADNIGDFAVLDASTIQFRIQSPATDDFPLPINLTINGAQATPAWLEGP